MFMHSKDSSLAFIRRHRFSPLSISDYLTLFDDIEQSGRACGVFLDAFAPAAGMLEVVP